MSTMRAPSLDLLRALRTATLPPSSTTMFHRGCSRGRAQLHSTIKLSTRSLATSSPLRAISRSQASNVSKPRNRAPKTHDRGPASEEDTQTDFSKMDILANAGAQTPATSVDACTADGFHLNNGTITSGGLGVLLLDGEAFVWTPWSTNLKSATSHTGGSGSGSGGQGFGAFLNKKGLLDIPSASLGILELVHPKPDLLIIGTGRKLWMLSPATRKYLFETLGIRVDVMDTANAAASYNLLAMERGVDMVAALLIPDGFRGN